MTNDSFDRALMDQMGQLPPVPGELDLCTPWHSAVGRILWGLALCTFRLEVFYLQYLLPLLGATLLYLGYRSLRRENRWFHLGWIMAGIHLAVQMTVLVLGGTPVLDRIGAIPWLNWSLTWALQAVNLLMLLSLRQGSRTAFALLTDADRPLWGRLAGLLDYADALQKHIDCGDVRTMEVVSPPPLTRSGTGNGLQPMAVRLLELLARLDPLRPEWPALLHARAGELAALSPEQYQALTGRFHAAQPQWDVHLERLACYLVFRHWPKAVNDDGLYPRVALTAAACLALHHLALLAWNDAPSFSDGDEALLWARFSREVEHDEANFFALAEALADLEQWPLAQIFQQ